MFCLYTYQNFLCELLHSMLKFIYFTKLVYIIDTVSQILKSGMSLNVFKKIKSPKYLFDIFFYLDRFEGF